MATHSTYRPGLWAPLLGSLLIASCTRSEDLRSIGKLNLNQEGEKPAPTDFVKAHPYYHASAFAEKELAAIDRSKTFFEVRGKAERPSYANVTNYSRGINGLALEFGTALKIEAGDLSFFVSHGTPSRSHEEFPTHWQQAPRAEQNKEAADNTILVLWPDQAIRNQWLKVVVKATPTNQLKEDRTLYLGHLAGNIDDAKRFLWHLSIQTVRSSVGIIVEPGHLYDFNGDQRVSFADILALATEMRNDNYARAEQIAFDGIRQRVGQVNDESNKVFDIGLNSGLISMVDLTYLRYILLGQIGLPLVVSDLDILAFNPNTSRRAAGISDLFDVDKNGVVDSADQQFVQRNFDARLEPLPIAR